MIERMLTVKELAHLLGVPKSWIYQRTRRTGPEVIPHIRVGKYIRFPPEMVREFIVSHRQGPLPGED